LIIRLQFSPVLFIISKIKFSSWAVGGDSKFLSSFEYLSLINLTKSCKPRRLKVYWTKMDVVGTYVLLLQIPESTVIFNKSHLWFSTSLISRYTVFRMVVDKLTFTIWELRLIFLKFLPMIWSIFVVDGSGLSFKNDFSVKAQVMTQ